MRLRHKMVRIARNLPLAAGQLSLSIAPVGRPYKERPNKGKSLGRECERARSLTSDGHSLRTTVPPSCALFFGRPKRAKKSRPQRPAFV